jgi:CheY-like chemotaxis protein
MDVAVVDAVAPEARLVGARILVVDDDVDSLELLGVILESVGASCCLKGSAAEALEAAKGETFDIIISDIGMPGADGHDFMRRLRAENVSAPAVALTGYGRPEDRDRARDAGFQMHVVKPLDTDALIAMLEDLLAKSRASG